MVIIIVLKQGETSHQSCTLFILQSRWGQLLCFTLVHLIINMVSQSDVKERVTCLKGALHYALEDDCQRELFFLFSLCFLMYAAESRRNNLSEQGLAGSTDSGAAISATEKQKKVPNTSYCSERR